MKDRRVFKIETNFGGTPVYEVFIRHGIAFVGCEHPGFADTMRSIREGDVLVIAAGYTVIAVAEVCSPAAEIHQYRLAPDKTLEYLDTEYGVPIMACRADIYPLDEQDYLWYKYRSRACLVDKVDIREAALELFNKYHWQRLGGIYAWATSELSQDATLCWLLNSLRTRSKYSVLARDVLNKMGVPESAKVSDMQVFRQIYHIDLILHFKQDGDDRVIVVEDKINASLYNNLQGYIESLVEYGLPDGFKPQREQVSACVLRTGDGNEGGMIHPNIQLVTRRDVIEVLEGHREIVWGSEILQGFYEKLQEWEDAYQGYKLKDAPEKVDRDKLESDNWAAWKGLYDYFCSKGILEKWHYVSQVNGGFMCGLFPWLEKTYKGCVLFMQFESSTGRLCMKLGEVYERQAEMRAEVVEKLFAYAAETTEFSPVLETTKARAGLYMTYAAIPISAWLKDSLEETVAYLRQVDEWYRNFSLRLADKTE